MPPETIAVGGWGDPLRELPSSGHAAVPDSASRSTVEKILEPAEELPPSPVDGTTGYDALALVGGLFIDPSGVGPLTELASEVTHEPADFGTVAARAKEDVLTDLMATEVHRLGSLFVDVCEQHRRYRDYARHELEEVVTAALVAFDVYRTYVGEDGDSRAQDRTRIADAIARVPELHPDVDEALLTFLGAILRADAGLDGPPERELRMRFQQLTGPTMAKGVEDTALYRHLGVVAANEVGGHPASPAISPEAFHEAIAERNRRWPATMLALTTHDTKRSEDVRARLSLLTEIADHWCATVRTWRATNRRHRGAAGPDGLTELLVYCTLVGAHPISPDRARQHLVKAMREAKRSTSWLRPDEAVEKDSLAFLDGLLGDREFLASLESFVACLLAPGRTNSLAMKLVQLTSPGVPDTYQGTELWDLSLVDPDNRRPVDYARRAAALAAMPATAELLPPLDEDDVGLAKLFVVKRALRLRSALPSAFAAGAGYEPLRAGGPKADHVVAFVRGGAAVTVVPRLPMVLDGNWADTTITLPDGTWHDQFAASREADDHVAHDDRRTFRGTVPLARLLSPLPVALLARTTR